MATSSLFLKVDAASAVGQIRGSQGSAGSRQLKQASLGLGLGESCTELGPGTSAQDTQGPEEAAQDVGEEKSQERGCRAVKSTRAGNGKESAAVYLHAHLYSLLFVLPHLCAPSPLCSFTCVLSPFCTPSPVFSLTLIYAYLRSALLTAPMGKHL